MIVGSWNVNSVRAREDRLLSWLERNKPDVLCLQEIKCVADFFPEEKLASLGYHSAVFGQKAYNGVAILSRSAPSAILRGMNDADDDPQARLIAATIDGVRIVSAYVPNGKEPRSDKYAYKKRWLARFSHYLTALDPRKESVVVVGDFNIARDERDVYDSSVWEGTVIYCPAMRTAFTGILGLGFHDSFRCLNDEGGKFSWWDYRRLSFPFNKGLRIDYVLVSDCLRGRISEAWIDRDERKGKKPSDHVPVLARLG